MNGLHGIIFSYEKRNDLRELGEIRSAASIPFGGRYRAVDFALSNLVNAGVTDVGIVLHGRYQSMLDHLGTGKVWDLSRKRGGLRMLPPFNYQQNWGVLPFRGKIEALAGVRTYLDEIRQDYVALMDGDLPLAAKVAPLDAEIDQKERDVESLCLKLLLQQQPVAKDLRQISAALKMITDMERIGDQAEDIAEIIKFLNGRTVENGALIREMASAAIKMVTESVDAFVKHDIMLAEKVVSDDDIVDRYFDQVKQKLIERIAQQPADGEYALDLLMIAKYFERIGDHAVNLAEWVIFSVTGVHKEE